MRSKQLTSAAILLAGLALVGAGCGKDGGQVGVTGGPDGDKPATAAGLVDRGGDITEDICAEFTADFIFSATGKTIVKVEPSPIYSVHACRYYTDYKADYFQGVTGPAAAGGPSINIVLDNLNVERQKKGAVTLGGVLGTDPRIKMDHWIIRRAKDNSIWGVHLALGPDRFVWTDSLFGAATDEEIIILAARMAEKIKGKLSIDIKKNPVDLAAAREAELGASQEAAARDFFELLGSGKIDEALALMDANDQTKAMWKTNFATLKSLKIASVEPAFRDEWAAARQVFKFTLDVKVTPQGEEFGWSNGKNFRWLTLGKKGDAWRVTEIANNP